MTLNDGRSRAASTPQVRTGASHRPARRSFILAVMAWIVAPYDVRAQSRRAVRVGILTAGGAVYHEALKQGLQERGWIEGKNIHIFTRDAKGESDMLRRLAAELIAAKPDAIFASTYLAVLAVTDQTASIPVVFAAISNPVGAGLVNSLSRPGGRLTGVASGTAPLAGKRLEILKDAIPRLERVAALYDATGQGEAGFEELDQAAARLGISVIRIGVSGPPDLERAFVNMRKQGADAVLVPVTARLFADRHNIIKLAARDRLPAIYGISDIADEGGLIAYGPNYFESHRRAAHHLDRILRGARPGDLPVEEMMRLELVVNLRAARAAAITFLPALLARADRVIE